ncbi:hypothetical protein T12_11659 [Trichinella patagoniensis]|uniref:Uncharacterized protein n=1 Tax=Trichinella patagoniensis TaxID=990121 RepID=A0A0V0ZQG8_9BILA|nr:hypothetical protein T12_11659 [Trichinella patagoniensis]
MDERFADKRTFALVKSVNNVSYDNFCECNLQFIQVLAIPAAVELEAAIAAAAAAAAVFAARSAIVVQKR